jgi:hypothetical protein
MISGTLFISGCGGADATFFVSVKDPVLFFDVGSIILLLRIVEGLSARNDGIFTSSPTASSSLDSFLNNECNGC